MKQYVYVYGIARGGRQDAAAATQRLRADMAQLGGSLLLLRVVPEITERRYR